MKPSIILWALLLSTPAVRADVGIPGFTRVNGFVHLEAGPGCEGYRFWLHSAQGIEPLKLAPGQPCRIDGRNRGGAHRIAAILAVPADRVADMPAPGSWKDFAAPPSWVSRSGAIDFRFDVPFYDSRSEVVDRYRVEVTPATGVKLVSHGWEPEPLTARIVRYVVGVSLFAAFAAGGVWAIRRFRRRK